MPRIKKPHKIRYKTGNKEEMIHTIYYRITPKEFVDHCEASELYQLIKQAKQKLEHLQAPYAKQRV